MENLNDILSENQKIKFENMPYYKEGNIIVILGNLGWGKTSFGELLVENAINVGKRQIAVNVFAEKYKNYHIVANEIEFFEYYLKYKDSKNLGLLLDETSMFANSKRAMNQNAVYTENLLVLLRKFYCFGIYICQRAELTLPSIRDLATIVIQKLGKKSAIMVIEDKVKIPLIDIFDTEIKFDTHTHAGFTFCMDMEIVLNKLSGLSKENADNKLREILDNKENYYNKIYKKQIGMS